MKLIFCLVVVCLTGCMQFPSRALNVIEARIDGEFTGWSGSTIFKLNNGQIWQQAEYANQYHYAINPAVTILPTISGYTMAVEGMDSTIRVVPVGGGIAPVPTGNVVEARIAGEFMGWSGST